MRQRYIRLCDWTLLSCFEINIHRIIGLMFHSMSNISQLQAEVSGWMWGTRYHHCQTYWFLPLHDYTKSKMLCGLSLVHSPLYCTSWLLHERSHFCKPRHKEWWDQCALKSPWPYQLSTNGPVPLPTAMSYIYTVFLLHLSSFSYNKGS